MLNPRQFLDNYVTSYERLDKQDVITTAINNYNHKNIHDSIKCYHEFWPIYSQSIKKLRCCPAEMSIRKWRCYLAEKLGCFSSESPISVQLYVAPAAQLMAFLWVWSKTNRRRFADIHSNGVWLNWGLDRIFLRWQHQAIVRVRYNMLGLAFLPIPLRDLARDTLSKARRFILYT